MTTRTGVAPPAYLDSSAIVKLVIREPQSKALRAFLRHQTRRVSSGISRTEVIRAVGPQGADAVERARAVLRGISLVSVDDTILETAATIEPAGLRTLDAIHIASAMSFGDLPIIALTYNRRMAAGLELAGVRVESPGGVV